MAGSTGVHDTVVNQLLSKLDGVEQLNNILVIGTRTHSHTHTLKHTPLSSFCPSLRYDQQA